MNYIQKPKEINTPKRNKMTYIDHVKKQQEKGNMLDVDLDSTQRKIKYYKRLSIFDVR